MRKRKYFPKSTILAHNTAMVGCVVIGCNKHIECDKDVSFHRITAATDHQGVEDFKLRKWRRDGYLAAISREALDYNKLDQCRIFLQNFVTGNPALLYSSTHPN